MSDWWTIGGALASVFGGVFSWIQAIKAKGYAKGISDGKKEAKGRSISNSLTELRSLSKDIKNQLGPTYVENKTAKEIQTTLNEYLTSYSSVLGSLGETTGKQLKELYDSIHNTTSLLADNGLRSNNLSHIQYLLGQVISETSKIIDESTF